MDLLQLNRPYGICIQANGGGFVPDTLGRFMYFHLLGTHSQKTWGPDVSLRKRTGFDVRYDLSRDVGKRALC